MKLSQFFQVSDLLAARLDLRRELEQLDEAKITVRVGQQSDRVYDDKRMGNAVRSSVRSELNSRLSENTSNLATLGVEIDAEPAAGDPGYPIRFILNRAKA